MSAKKTASKDDVDHVPEERPASTPRARRRSASTSAIATTSTWCPTTRGSRPS